MHQATPAESASCGCVSLSCPGCGCGTPKHGQQPRPVTNTINWAAEVLHDVAYTTHTSFNSHGCLNWYTPCTGWPACRVYKKLSRSSCGSSWLCDLCGKLQPHLQGFQEIEIKRQIICNVFYCLGQQQQQQLPQQQQHPQQQLFRLDAQRGTSWAPNWISHGGAPCSLS